MGLSDKSEVVKLYGDNEIASGASIVEGFRQNKERYKPIHSVPVMSADTIFYNEDIRGINFIKVDVEGAELEVIKGFRFLLEKFHPVVIMEILPVYSLDTPNGKMRKEREGKLLDIMKLLNYHLFLIHEKNIRLEKLDDIPVHGDMNRTNYLFIPNEETEKFNDLMISY